MSSTDRRVTVRSYRSVFRFERRLYRFDRWRLPVHGGVPLRALLYLPAVYGVLLLAGRIPGLGAALGLLPDPVHWALLPLAAVWGLLRVEVDGRPAHRALWAILRWRLSSRWLAGLRPCSPPGPAPLAVGSLVVRPDWRSAEYRPGRVRGPARVLLRYPATLRTVRGLLLGTSERLEIEPVPGARPMRRGKLVAVPTGGELRA